MRGNLFIRMKGSVVKLFGFTVFCFCIMNICVILYNDDMIIMELQIVFMIYFSFINFDKYNIKIGGFIIKYEM